MQDMRGADDDQRQIKQMMNFMISEAKEKAMDIIEKGKEEVSIEVHKQVTEGKQKILAEYESKFKSIETLRKINHSKAITEKKMEKIKERQEVMLAISKDAKEALGKALSDQAKCKDFVTKLIVQGLLMLLESEVTVKCRQKDVPLVKSCMEAAVSQYKDIVKKESKADKSCKLTIDESNYLPPAEGDKEGKSCLGGIVLACFGGKITVDNTIDARLKLVLEQDKPEIRKKLFA
jgi:V-type H+-transporting ATPase subunit E